MKVPLCFLLTKWSTNAEEILNIKPEEARASALKIITLNGSPSQVYGTIGLQWALQLTVYYFPRKIIIPLRTPAEGY